MTIMYELERLKKVHKQDKDEYSAGIVTGLELAIDVIKNKEFYED